MMKKIKDISETGFKTPDNYFENFEEGVFARLKAEKLKSLADKPGFEVPDGYFEDLDKQIETRIKGDSTAVISLLNRKNIYYVSGVAAAIVILLAVFLNRSSNEVQELDYRVVETYIINHDISTYEIASLLTEDELDQVDLNILGEEINEETLEDYLLENINLENIIEQ